MTARAVVIHSLDHARAALAAATRLRRPILLHSAEGAAAYAGAGWFLAMVAAARADYPAADCEAVLDCGTQGGVALAALRGGCPAIVLHGAPALRRKIAAIAAVHGAKLADAAQETLDLEHCPDPEAAVLAWLGEPGTHPATKAL
jgi:fructose/tagatose bisphosphate aldolase